MDGWVTIGTQLDSSQIEKDIKDIEKQLIKFQKEEEKLLSKKEKLELDTSDFEKAEEEFEKLRAEAMEYKQRIKDLEIKRKRMPTTEKGISMRESVTAEIEDTRAKLAELVAESDKYAEKLDKAVDKYDRQKEELNQINQKININKASQEELNTKLDSFNKKIASSKGFESLKNSISSANDGMSHLLKKVAKWTLAMFSIRGAYSLLTRASSTLSQYNSQYSADLDYMRFVLAQSLAPILQNVLQIIYKILAYVNYISQAWFGVNLFANASADAFGKAKNNLDKANKSVKELKKQTASFDEMNILTETGDVESAGVGTQVQLPSVDLSNIENIPIPEWLQWIKDNKDILIAGLLGIAGGLLAIKLGASGLIGLGIGVAILGIVMAFQELNKYIKDPSLEQFGKVAMWVGVAILGLGLAFGSLPVAITGAVIAIFGALVTNWGKITEWWQGVRAKIDGVSEWIHKHLGEPIGNTFDFIIRMFDNLKKNADTFIEGIRNMFDGLGKIFEGIFNGDWEEVWEGVKQFIFGWFEQIWARIKSFFDIAITVLGTAFTFVINLIKDVAGKIWEKITWVKDKIVEIVSKIWNKITEIASKIWDSVTTIFSTIAEWINEHVIQPIINFFTPLFDWFKKLFESIGNFIKSVFEVIGGIAKGCVETIKIVWGVVSNWFNEHIIKPVKEFFENLWNTISSAGENAWNTIKNIWEKVSNWFTEHIINPIKETFTRAWNTIKEGAETAWNGIQEVFGKVGNFFKETFEKAWNGVKNIFSTGGKIFDGIKEGIVTNFKNIVNAIIRGINKVIKVPFDGINGALNKIRDIDIFGNKPFGGLPTISIPKIPELAVGGIVNMPGKGVMLGSAIVGEAGREGVLPLTDTGAMRQLGKEIGQWITINANITNEMNGKILSRELQKIQTKSAFAYNS